jgi:RimJ/RimL family protein N-acetyltransferase
MIGSSHQGRGYAKEAADGMLTWLREQNVESFAAHIRPDHTASIAIARHLGLRATRRLAGEEVLWISQAPPSDPGQS